MTTSVNYHRIASDCYSSNTCDVGGRLSTVVRVAPDTDSVGFASNTAVADIDIVIPCEKDTGAKAYPNIVVATCVALERTETDGCVLGAGSVAIERRATVGGVVAASGVAKERDGTGGCVVVAGGVAIECKHSVGCVVGARGVGIKRRVTVGCVAVGSVEIKRRVTAGCIQITICVAIERIKADRRISEPIRQAEEGIIPRSSVRIGIASAWCRKNRSSCWRKRKADEYERHENHAGG
jgi:hypothetical protein